MNKIYSRPRIDFSKFGSINKKMKEQNNKFSKKIKFKILFIIIVSLVTVRLVLDTILPTVNSLCINQAKSIATIVSNEQVKKIMDNHSYSEMYKIEKDANGNLLMIRSDVLAINKIVSEIATNIQNEINLNRAENVKIALGSFLGMKLLSGRGPKIAFKIYIVGNVDTKLKSEFLSEGINQTLHRIYLQVKCNVNILTPYEDIETVIENQILLAENIMIGGIPETFYNLDGLNREDVMEVME